MAKVKSQREAGIRGKGTDDISENDRAIYFLNR